MTPASSPIDTSGIKLPAELLALTELLARHAHEVWHRQRLAEGWKFGPCSPRLFHATAAGEARSASLLAAVVAGLPAALVRSHFRREACNLAHATPPAVGALLPLTDGDTAIVAHRLN